MNTIRYMGKCLMNYKISVIVATYNSGDFLNEFLDSIKSQSLGFEDIEVIFVDDASTDDYTLDLLNNFNESYPNVSVIFLDENSGFPGTGRNRGLDLAGGEYVIFADHDDSYVENAFEVMYDKINENDMLISNFNQVFDDKVVKFKSLYKDTPTVCVKNIDEDRNLLRIPAAIWTRLFRKDFLVENNIRFLERMLCEDVYVATLGCLKAEGIIYLNDFYSYNYKIRDSEGNRSTIHIRNRKYIEAMLDGYYEIAKMLEKENKTGYGKEIFRQHLTSWLYTIVLSKLDSNDKKELFEKSYDIFKMYYTQDLYFKKRYNNLVDNILSKDFDKAVVEANKLEKTQENMNDRKKNRPRGRPKISGVCKLSKAVTVKFSKIDYERLCRRSRQANLTLAEFLRVSAFETTITARHSAEETAVIRSLTGMANNLNQLTRLSHQTGFHRTQRTVTELLQKLKEIIIRYRHGERRPS